MRSHVRLRRSTADRPKAPSRKQRNIIRGRRFSISRRSTPSSFGLTAAINASAKKPAFMVGQTEPRVGSTTPRRPPAVSDRSGHRRSTGTGDPDAATRCAPRARPPAGSGPSGRSRARSPLTASAAREGPRRWGENGRRARDARSPALQRAGAAPVRAFRLHRGRYTARVLHESGGRCAGIVERTVALSLQGPRSLC